LVLGERTIAGQGESFPLQGSGRRPEHSFHTRKVGKKVFFKKLWFLWFLAILKVLKYSKKPVFMRVFANAQTPPRACGGVCGTTVVSVVKTTLYTPFYCLHDCGNCGKL